MQSFAGIESELKAEFLSIAETSFPVKMQSSKVQLKAKIPEIDMVIEETP